MRDVAHATASWVAVGLVHSAKIVGRRSIAPGPVQAIVLRVGYDDLPIAYANEFLVQAQPESCFVMGIGQSTPPALIGSPQQIAEQAAQIEFVRVRPLAKVALTEDKMKELIAALHASLEADID